MYLKKLELKGFKSFPDKTEIIFEKGITSIVGPNGSGKSNVSDAIRWVLGEQSIKSLRGEKLEDVIFAGSHKKKHMNYCEVALTIDNSENILDIDYSEVTIKRIAYKSGESEFYLNNKSCRLKDIKEMLLDTGIGREGYSVIEQGKIDEILSSSANNRRRVFDEACGISKYRYKKLEGEKNLKNAKENLDRINDIYLEIEGQIKPLESQKNKAVKYLEIKNELKMLEINKYLKENEATVKELSETNSHKEILNSQMAAIDKDKNKAENEIVDYEESLLKLESKISDQSTNIFTFKSEIEKREANFNLLNEKILNLDANIDNKNKEIIKLDSSLIKNSKDIGELLADKEELSLKLKTLLQEKSKVEEKIKEQTQALRANEESSDKYKDAILNHLNDKNNKNLKLSAFNTNLENMKTRNSAISNDLSELEEKISKKNEEIVLKLELKENITKRLCDLNLEKKSIEENLNKCIVNHKLSINEEQKLNLMINECASKLRIYYDMEKQYEGYNKGAKEVLKNKALRGIEGSVAEIINVSKEIEVAIEIALGGYLQNIITQNESNAKDAIQFLKERNFGRVTFLPLSTINGKALREDELPKVDGVIGIASRLINFDEKYDKIIDFILGKTILVEDVDIAIKLGKLTNHKYKIVTLDGEVFSAGGALTGGSIKNNNNILSRKRLIDELEVEKENFKEKMSNIVRDKIALEEKVDALTVSLTGFDEKIQDQKLRDITVDTETKSLEQEIKSLEVDIHKLKKEDSSIKENMNYTQELCSKLSEEINQLTKECVELEEKILKLSQDKVSFKSSYEEDLDVLNKNNLEITKYSETLNSKNKDIVRIQNDIKNLEKSVFETKAEVENFEKNRQDFNEEILIVKVEKQELVELYNAAIVKLDEYKLKKEQLLNKLKLNKQEFKLIEDKHQKLRESIYKLELRMDKLSNNQEMYYTRLWEEYELTHMDALEFKNEEVIIDKRKIENLKSDIKRLGNINIDSIKEYEEISERYLFYKTQKEDLEKSIDTIENFIKDVESNMKNEFSLNFEKINNTFVNVYSKLFEGGYGELKILDIDNVLDSDIEIIAQPPGKKLKNINLLSGGEKALTAICVLFAILLTKPTPFCVLDEIEAPLDDANIYRFGEFLKELSNKTQFITITHRRGTMECSDYIYGVTMQEKAISKVVSLKLEEAQMLTNENII